METWRVQFARVPVRKADNSNSHGYVLAIDGEPVSRQG